ncbi:hypothetical protein Golob_017546 [Gossypium lobatum]|uniref:Reverse transcriptase zinc-binding domain-containing protein n=1 Tax=Gossypium lobatum TaxID=34289 RepID=A0A7J8M810_9ROSI|nr:hypothetical protein [Gossypium lobatum]
MSGSFFVKSTCEKLREGLWNSNESIWQLPWKFQGLQRVRFFIWLALKEQLLTNAEKKRRGIGMNIACGICGHDYENVLHVLRDCTAAKDIWNQLIPIDRSFPYFREQLGSLEYRWFGKDQKMRSLQLEGFCVIKMGSGLLASVELKLLISSRMEYLGGSNSALVRRILVLLKLLSHWSLQHVSREDNKFVDKIVNMVRDRRTGLQLMKDLIQMDSL